MCIRDRYFLCDMSAVSHQQLSEHFVPEFMVRARAVPRAGDEVVCVRDDAVLRVDAEDLLRGRFKVRRDILSRGCLLYTSKRRGHSSPHVAYDLIGKIYEAARYAALRHQIAR